jgi:hypothetical protein
MDAKLVLFAVDSYFRDAWEDLRPLPEGDVDLVLRRHALLLLKPDAVAGRRLLPALDWLAAHAAVVVAARRLDLGRHHARAMWQYQWNVATRDRRDLADQLLAAGSSLLLLLRLPAGGVPATVVLSSAKGPADPAGRRPGQLRERLGDGNFLLNYVHAADEPADLVRELGVLLDSRQRRAVLAEMLAGADAGARALALAGELYRDAPAHPLTVAPLLDRVDALVAAGDPAAGRATAALAAAGVTGADPVPAGGRGTDWRALVSQLRACGVTVDRWDQIVLGTSLMAPSEPDRVPLLSGVPTRQWGRHPATPPIADVVTTAPAVVSTAPAVGPTPAVDAAVRPARSLRYDRPVPRALVHKAGVGEVLVTDSARLADDRFLIAAELPAGHRYLGDLPGDRPGHDLMAVLEAARQSLYVVAHTYRDVPADHCFLLRRFAGTLVPGLPPPPDGPVRLRLECVVTRVHHRPPVPGLRLRLAVSAEDGSPVATASALYSWTAPDHWPRLRGQVPARGPSGANGMGLAGRSGRSGGSPAGRDGHRRQPVTPPVVGRSHPGNVLLAAAHRDGLGFTAAVRVDPGNRSMIEHSVDHLPGMVLLEAARQATLWAAGAPAVLGLDASFLAFGELDLPVRADGRLDDTGAAVELTQAGATVAKIRADLTPRHPRDDSREHR